MTRVLPPLMFLVLIISSFAITPVQAQSGESCFAETGFCMSGAIRSYWEGNGGLAVFGFPITAQSVEQVEGQPLQVQWFERDRLEIQPSGLVTAGRLGVERLEQLGTPWQQGPNSPAGAGCRAFPETGYQVCGAFAAYWQANGGLERFGFPVTGEFTTELEGRPYTVQYFERRRFELHPEIEPDAVLLGLLGREVYSARQAQPQPQLEPPAPPSLPPPSFNECQADPNAAQAANYPVRIVIVAKSATPEVVRLQNVSPEPVNLDGWIMCSIRGNQRHDGIGGVLSPGEVRDFPYTGSGTIWNNNDDDDGALYNAQGQLVSYWDN
ncbi:MAG: lamin tail domain-containing protein [Oscillochloris sp.]|nr:lamin tail domain-containing protein [Oscillochloris sp.]